MAAPSHYYGNLAEFATWLGVGFFGLAVFGFWPGEPCGRKNALVFGLTLTFLVWAAGCGMGSPNSPAPNPNGTPAGAYNVTVSATGNGNVTHKTTAVLMVN
jgi:hypothetical protein